MKAFLEILIGLVLTTAFFWFPIFFIAICYILGKDICNAILTIPFSSIFIFIVLRILISLIGLYIVIKSIYKLVKKQDA